MITYHPLYMWIEIPDDKAEIEEEICRCRKRFIEMPEFDHYLQAKIDCLEDALGKIL